MPGVVEAVNEVDSGDLAAAGDVYDEGAALDEVAGRGTGVAPAGGDASVCRLMS